MTTQEKETLEAIKTMGIGRTNKSRAEKQLLLKGLELLENEDRNRLNKMYALGILADIMAQANYIITLPDGSQKLCVDTAIINEVIDELEADINKEEIKSNEDINIEDR